MENRLRLRRSGLAVAGLVLLGVAGCDGGGGASDGDRVVLPPTYKEREKEIGDAMVNAMKSQRAPKGRKAQAPGTQPR